MPSQSDLERGIVLIGAQPSHGTSNTTGTGFVVEHKGRCYIVTCKHVLSELPSGRRFAIPRPRKTKHVPTVLWLGEPKFHPNEGGRGGTLDIAALEITNGNKQFLDRMGVRPLHVTPDCNHLLQGVELIAAGYPIDYAERELARKSNDHMLPLLCHGRIQPVPVQILNQIGFDGQLADGHFAQTNDIMCLGKGASGGPVFRRDKNAISIVGVLLGTAELKVSEEAIRGFVFAGSDRILELL